MRLSELITCLPTAIQPSQDLPQLVDSEIRALTMDSRQAEEGAVFIAIRGSKTDGHQFLPTVCAQGASAVVVEDVRLVPVWYWGTVIHVKSSRAALDRLASAFYQNPSKSLYCVGVTGTNGKTTTTHLIEHLLNFARKPTGVIGTIDHHLGRKVWPSALTTPDAISLQRRLSEFLQAGAQAVAMEVSSHALSQARADSVDFDCAVFTNFTRDHLDYHATMEDYFLAKQRLFTDVIARSSKADRVVVVNADDPEQKRLQVAPGVRSSSYGMAAEADYRFAIKKEDFAGSVFELTAPQGSIEIELPMAGRFNVTNAAAAIAVAQAAGVDLQTCQKALASFQGVSGRLQAVANTHQVTVLVDYAHTDDALRSVLRTLQAIRTSAQTQSRIITVFGCGGDRDPGKRPLMMQVARSESDLVVVTSDNPRSEDPNKIIADCLASVPQEEIGVKVWPQSDRRQAIEMALNLAQAGDVVLIAGKGHETYQILGDQRIHFSDAEVVREIWG